MERRKWMTNGNGKSLKSDPGVQYSGAAMNLPVPVERLLPEEALGILRNTRWTHASCEAIASDASTRRYFRLQLGAASAILMDGARDVDSVIRFVRVAKHLRECGFSTPEVLACDEANGFLLLEDFGKDTLAGLLDKGSDPEWIFGLGVDCLVELHKLPQALAGAWRRYSPELMLADAELFLDWGTVGIPESGREEFRAVWREILPEAHAVPASLLLRDYHMGNLMHLPGRSGVQQAGLLDFQDAYQGPVTYDLISLLEDARRDIPTPLKEKMLSRYRAGFPLLDRDAFELSCAILAALRHTRVLAVFDRLSRREGRHDYKSLHSPRVKRLLREALRHPRLAGVKRWMDAYAR